MNVATLSHFESVKGTEAKKEDEDSATVYSIYSNATTVKMNNRSGIFLGRQYPMTINVVVSLHEKSSV